MGIFRKCWPGILAWNYVYGDALGGRDDNDNCYDCVSFEDMIPMSKTLKITICMMLFMTKCKDE